MREALGRTFEASLDRFRQRGRRSVERMVRLTAAAVASYVVAGLVFPRSAPLLAPLTALLVVQLTPVSILASGVQRVGSVVAGVTVAVGFSSLVHITWWSLGTVIALSLLIGQLLRLGPNLLEVPISAMLVLGVGSRTADSAAGQRIAETLVGAGVGVLSNLIFPPKVTSEDAASAIEDLGHSLARLLESAADEVVGDLSTAELRDRAARWLGEVRRLTHDIPNVGIALLRAEESRRLNLRALGTVNSGPGLRQGMEALEHSALAVRSMFRSLLEAAQTYEAEDRGFPPELRTALAGLLHEIASALRSFGRLVHAESRPGDPSSELAALRDAITTLAATYQRVAERLQSEPRSDTALAVLTVSLLATVKRLLQELDVDNRARPDHRPPPTLAQLVTHPWDPSAKARRPPWRRRRGDDGRRPHRS